MDRLAAEGMRFTDAHASSAVCTPSRYTILTGRYHWRTHLQRGVLGQMKEHVEGVYIWFYPSSMAVTYIGETGDFAGRHTQHLASLLGYGGTAFSLHNVSDPYSAMHHDNIAKSAEAGLVLYPWTVSKDKMNQFLCDMQTGERLKKRLEAILIYLRQIRIIQGVIPAGIDRREIEGGLIRALRDAHKIGSGRAHAQTTRLLAAYRNTRFKTTSSYTKAMQMV
jgi:hypothetical protein